MSKKILIVDDSLTMRQLVKMTLTRSGYDVVEAEDGQKGLQKASHEAFDLVLSDINMSNMDGYEFIRRIRADKKYSALPIIIVSTQSEAKDKSKGFAAGANLYLVKPCTPEMMVENIRMVLTPS